MSQTFHGITGWVRIGNTRIIESRSGLRTAQLTYQCAGITTSPPFTEGQALSAPFNEYVVYPNPPIGIGQDGISTCNLEAYDANLNLKRDERRKILVNVDGEFTNYFGGAAQTSSMITSILVDGAYVQDCQHTNAQTLPTTAITFGYQILAARTLNKSIPLTSSFIVRGDFLVTTYNQDYLGSVVNTEAIYQSSIFYCSATGNFSYSG